MEKSNRLKKEIDKLNKGYFAHGFTCNIQQ